jgi:hypothetical protein
MTKDELLPVHCCCTPMKRLGYVPVRRLSFTNEAWFNVMNAGAVERVIRTEIGRVWLDRARVGDVINGHVENTRIFVDAVKSAHEPIEVWRRVPGFIENQGDIEAEAFEDDLQRLRAQHATRHD